MAFKHRYGDGWYKNANGVYVQMEPIGSALVTAASTNDIPRVKSDNTIELATLTAGTDITVTHGVGTITIASTASGGGATVLYDSGAIASAANSIDTGASGIAGGYSVVEIFALLRTDEAVANSTVLMRFNNDSTSGRYFRERVTGANTTASAGVNNTATGIDLSSPGSSCASGVFGPMRCAVPFYAETTAHKTMEMAFGNADTTDGNKQMQVYLGRWNQTSAITRISFTAPAGKNFVAGSHVIIYGR